MYPEPFKNQADVESLNDNCRIISVNKTPNAKSYDSKNNSAKDDNRKTNRMSNDDYNSDHYNDTVPLAKKTDRSNKLENEQVNEKVMPRQNQIEPKLMNQETREQKYYPSKNLYLHDKLLIIIINSACCGRLLVLMVWFKDKIVLGYSVNKIKKMINCKKTITWFLHKPIQQEI